MPPGAERQGPPQFAGDGDYLAIEWYDAACPYSYASSGSAYFITFEVLLYESGIIKMQYLDAYTAYTSYAYGLGASIGIENQDGTSGLEYSYNTASVYNSDAIEYYPPNLPSFPEIPEETHIYIDDHPQTATPKDVLKARLMVRDDDTGYDEINPPGGRKNTNWKR